MMRDAPMVKREVPRFSLTDTGNASRYAEDHRNRLAYIVGPGWHCWNGICWIRDNDVEPYRAAKESARGIRTEAQSIQDEEIAKKVFAHAIQSESKGKLKNMVDLAQVGEIKGPGLVRKLETFDAKPHLLSVPNGTINLCTGQLCPHNAADYLTRYGPVAYDPDAKCRRWLRFIEETFGGHKELMAYMQRATGYALTGEMREEALFALHGLGGNGKTVLVETISKLLGDYTATAAADTFIGSRGGGIPSDLARLRGTRLVRIPETEDGARFARQVVKRITGRDMVTARFMYQDFFEYLPTFKIWLVTNHLPAIPHTDGAMWRRIHLVPFNHKPKKPDDKLQDKLAARELPGILAWAVRGAREWYQRGLDEPNIVRQAVLDYRIKQDTISGFFADCYKHDANGEVVQSTIYPAYREWCASEGVEPVSRKALGAALDERGFTRKKDPSGVRLRVGLTAR